MDNQGKAVSSQWPSMVRVYKDGMEDQILRTQLWQEHLTEKVCVHPSVPASSIDCVARLRDSPGVLTNKEGRAQMPWDKTVSGTVLCPPSTTQKGAVPVLHTC